MILDETTPDAVAEAARRLGPPDTLVATVLDIAGARSLALDALLRLSAIEWSADVATACVECADRPRLLINPEFVERWCFTRERLATLLLHELSHVSMGHTRLFPRPTWAHNVACDAVINRELLGTVVDVHADLPRFAALFEDCYVPDRAPWFLLRPPPGWPAAPDWNASASCPERLRELHRRLYATQSESERGMERYHGTVAARHTVMYSEIVAALESTALVGIADGDKVLARLLGGHGVTARERALLSGGRDAAASEALADALQALRGRYAGSGGDAFAHQIERGARGAALERALAALLRRAFVTSGVRRGPPIHVSRPTRTVDPRCDRRAPARTAIARALGAPRPLLFDAPVVEPRPTPRDLFVYLDASGSMFGVLPALHAALVPLCRVLRPRLHAFSTEVVPVCGREFDRGRVPTTGGTSIAPVLEHLLAHPPHRRATSALVVTDGWFDRPTPELARAVRDAGIRIHLAIAGANGPLHDGADWIASATRLPTP